MKKKFGKPVIAVCLNGSGGATAQKILKSESIAAYNRVSVGEFQELICKGCNYKRIRVLKLPASV